MSIAPTRASSHISFFHSEPSRGSSLLTVIPQQREADARRDKMEQPGGVHWFAISCHAFPRRPSKRFSSIVSKDFNIDRLARLFARFSRNQGLNLGEGASPDSFFPSFRLGQSQQLTNRGNGKVCFMKTKTSLARSSMNRSPLRNGFFSSPSSSHALRFRRKREPFAEKAA